MKAYGVKQSHRPGCACCNTRDYHHYRGVKVSASVKRAKAAAKKRARRFTAVEWAEIVKDDGLV
jgi:hypothetical protein